MDMQQRFSDMRTLMAEELRRKSQRRLDITTGYRGARSQQEECERQQKQRSAGQFHGKIESERKQREEMLRRIQKLEALETRLTENLRETLSFHEQEVSRLDQLVRGVTE